jgi:cystathionine beta-lyase
MEYLKGNLEYLLNYFKENIPSCKVIVPEGTYLIWVDCRQLGMNSKELNDFFLNKAKVWFNNGRMFGDNGEGFVRINIACPRKLLKEGLERVKKALNS